MRSGLGRYRLAPEEVEALKDGGAERLAAAGVDVARWQREPLGCSWALSLLARLAPAACAAGAAGIRAGSGKASGGPPWV